MSKNKDKLIIVCAECLTASCWYGEFMCDKAGTAKTKQMMASELEKLALEHPDNWSDDKLYEVYG